MPSADVALRVAATECRNTKVIDSAYAAVRVGGIGLLIGLPWLFASSYLLGLIGYSLLIVQASRQRPGQAFVYSMSAGVIALVIAFHWAANSIFDITNLSYPLSIVVFCCLICWEAIAFGMLGWATSVLVGRGNSWIWASVPIWVAIQTCWPRIFNWETAYAYLGFPPVLQVVEFTGTSGITACVVLGSVAVSRLMLLPRSSRAIAGSVMAIILITGLCVWGEFKIRDWRRQIANAPSLNVVSVQVDPSFVESLGRMQQFSDAFAGHVDLLLWPESTLGNYHVSLDHFGDDDYTYDHAEMPNPAVNPYPNIHCDLLAGGKTYDDGGRGRGPYRNTAFLLDRKNRVTSRYVKRSLMPIGEYVPGETWLPVLREWAALGAELVRGTSDAPLTLSNGSKVGMLICYEDMVARNASSSVHEGANFLVALANGSAFKDPDTLQQRLHLAQLRTIENRRALVRCAATGVTCLIQPDGTLSDKIPIAEDGVMKVRAPLVHELTFYTRNGEWFATCSTAISLLILPGLLFRRRSKQIKSP